MGRKFRDSERSAQHRVQQKNGDVYVYERVYKYNPETRKTERISNRLVGKVRKGTNEIVPTRSRKAPQQDTHSESVIIEAGRTRRMLTDILTWAGRESGVDEDLLIAMNSGDALKTMSLARFLTATGGDTVPHIEAWQLTHPVPYEEGLSDDVCYALFRTLGEDETARQRFFRARAMRLGSRPLLAFDSTTISTWSELQEEARYGYNKAGDGLKTIKFTTIYDAVTRQPIAFGKQPGDLPDVTGLLMLLSQMEVLGLRDPQIVTDNGYWSENNVMAMCRAHLDFITLAKPGISWIRPVAEEAMKSIHCGRNLEDGGGLYVTTKRVMHTFAFERRYASRKKNLAAGAREDFTRRLYVHVCFDPVRKEQGDVQFFERLKSLKRDLEMGIRLDEMKPAAQSAVRKYLKVRFTSGGTVRNVEWNDEACAKACQFHGVFVLVASHEKDGFQALRKYRRREKIEEFFQLYKEDTDGARPRVRRADSLMGRMLVQFAALCYTDFLQYRIQKVKTDLEALLEHDEGTARPKAELQLDRKLLDWLNKTSFLGVLEWFDAYEDIDVSEAIRHRRWNAQTTKRDRRFLSLLMS